MKFDWLTELFIITLKPQFSELHRITGQHVNFQAFHCTE